jgi:hypothetical protein
MAIELMYTQQIVEDSGVKILTYSDAGVGKTVLVATLPRPVLISAESGLLSLRKENVERIFGPTGLPFSDNILTIQVTTLEQLREAYQWVVHPDSQQYFDSVALDSLSEMAEKILAHFKPLNKDPRKAYGEMQDEVMDLIKKFRDIKGKHVYMSAKMGKDKDELTGQLLWGPSMPGQKLGPQLPYLFDEVFRYQIVTGQDGAKTRMLQTQPGLNDSAKDRSGVLNEFEFPHLGYIINKIKAKGNQ